MSAAPASGSSWAGPWLAGHPRAASAAAAGDIRGAEILRQIQIERSRLAASGKRRELWTLAGLLAGLGAGALGAWALGAGAAAQTLGVAAGAAAGGSAGLRWGAGRAVPDRLSRLASAAEAIEAGADVELAIASKLAGPEAAELDAKLARWRGAARAARPAASAPAPFDPSRAP